MARRCEPEAGQPRPGTPSRSSPSATLTTTLTCAKTFARCSCRSRRDNGPPWSCSICTATDPRTRQRSWASDRRAFAHWPRRAELYSAPQEAHPMAELKEIFEMVTSETEPDLGAWTEQERRQRRVSRNRKYVAIAVVAAIIVALGVFAATADQNETTRPAQPTPSPASDVSRSYARQTIFGQRADGSSVAVTQAFWLTSSPDGTMIAFLRDPRDPLYDKGGDPFVLQVCLIHQDGSGLRKLGQQHECCIGAIPDIRWSPDGSSIVLPGIHKERIDVATGESLPMQGG